MRGTILASILSAVGASLCCIGPAMVLLFGSTTLGAFSFLEPVRPYTSVLAIGLLGVAHVRVRRKEKEECCDVDDAEAVKRVRLQKRTVWGVTPVVLALILFPYVGSFLHASGEKDEDKGGLVQAEWTIEGMTCQWCATGLEAGMNRVEGVSKCTVDYRTKSMVCAFDKKVVSADAIPAVVEKMGYKAIPADKKEDGKNPSKKL